MPAELIYIEGGDHMFVVLNRLPNSKLSDPATWGEGAVICDPWAKDKENQVYPAVKYLTKLKNFKFDSATQRNILEDFNVKTHSFASTGYEMKKFRKLRTVVELKYNFKAALIHLIEVLTNFHINLMNEKDRLQGKYGKEDSSVKTLYEKLINIEKTMQSLQEAGLELINKNYAEDYRTVLLKFSDAMRAFEYQTTVTIKLSLKEIFILGQHKGTDFGTDIMKYFNMPNTTEDNLKRFTNEANYQLSKRKWR